MIPGPVELGDGTRIQLYKDGEALHAAYQAIRHAKHRVCLEVYIFASDSTGRAFADLLCEKSRQGVRVYVMYDGFGSVASDGEMFRKMKRAGVSVQEFHPVWPWECMYSWRPAFRDHRKLLVVDSDIAGMGGLNIGAEYAGSWVVRRGTHEGKEAWRDNAIGIVGPKARLLMDAFAKTWHYVNHGGRIRTAEFVHRPSGEDFWLLSSVPTMSSPLAPTLQGLVRGAKKSIQLTMAYFAPTDGMIEELCRAARRGVRVRIMLPEHCDLKLLRIAARSFYETLLSAGAEVYERKHVVLHAKTMVVDECVTAVGSTNLDYRSIEYNCELSAVIRSGELGRQMCELFEHDVKFARRICLAEWRRRPMWDRVVQWAVNRSRYVL